MNSKTIVMFALTVGSVIGGYIPVIFGIEAFSFISLITSAIGGLAGVFIALKYTDTI